VKLSSLKSKKKNLKTKEEKYPEEPREDVE
jgi:hypothetical protein